MRIHVVRIENFRSIRTLECRFDEITTFVGPNGSGKSTILRALDWFFNGSRDSLAEEDIHFAAPHPRRVRVCVEFAELTATDRETLGPKYAGSEGSSFTVWRTWDESGDKITGKALAYAEFEPVRASLSASAKRAAYNELRAMDPSLGLAPCTSAAAVDAAMDAWEAEHPERLTDAEVSATHLFGFNGLGKLAELFDFVFVSADFRAGEEVTDGKDSILGRILQRALERDDLQEAVAALTDKFAQEYGELNDLHLNEQLTSIGAELTAEVGSYTHGRAVELSASVPTVRPQAPRIEVQVSDSVVRTPVERQGHGLQRTLLVGALTVLSRRSRSAETPGQMFLAVEEPELFQHPTQARAFASVLRSIAFDGGQAVQVAYATHSPYFVEPRYFDEIRRVTTARMAGGSCAETRITTASLDHVCEQLEGYIKPENIRRRWDQVCLKYLPEALFAETVILVEGDEDAAILQGLGARRNDLALAGICVAPVSGKNNMMIPFTVLSELQIQALMVVDNDSGAAERMHRDGKSEDQIEQAMTKQTNDNRALCRLVGVAEEDFPTGAVSATLVFIPDTLESLLASDLPGWDGTRHELIAEGRGVDGKHAATYEIAARECETQMGTDLFRLMELVVGGRAA